jgi:fucose permease
MYVLVGLGSGFHNAAWNVWIGNMANSHEVLGFFHGFYGVGATISPLVATSLIIKAGWEWYCYYYLMVSRHSLQPLDIDKLTMTYRPEPLLSR